MKWTPPDDAPCRDCPTPEIFVPERITTDNIVIPVVQYCRFCPDQSGCLQEGIRLRAWGVWGGVGLIDGKPVRQPSPRATYRYIHKTGRRFAT